MIKFVDIDNGYIFDGTSYVETLTCKKCGCKINNNTISKDLSRCPNVVLGRECGGEMIQEITGPHHIFWFDDAQSTDIYYIKKICILTDNKHGYFNPLNKKHILPISISNNNIFKLVDINEVNSGFHVRQISLDTLLFQCFIFLNIHKKPPIFRESSRLLCRYPQLP